MPRGTNIPCVQKKNEPPRLNILYYQVNCTELNIVKYTQKLESIWVIVLKFCTIPPYHLTYYETSQISFSHILLTHGAYVMRDVKLC